MPKCTRKISPENKDFVNPIPYRNGKTNLKTIEVMVHPTTNTVGKSSSQKIDKWDNPPLNSEGKPNSTEGIMDDQSDHLKDQKINTHINI